MVEGADGARLAVECDGDAWLRARAVPAGRVSAAPARAGRPVAFCARRESLFHADRERAIDEVVDAAEEVGIYLPGANPENVSREAELEYSPSPAMTPQQEIATRCSFRRSPSMTMTSRRPRRRQLALVRSLGTNRWSIRIRGLRQRRTSRSQSWTSSIGTDHFRRRRSTGCTARDVVGSLTWRRPGRP